MRFVPLAAKAIDDPDVENLTATIYNGFPDIL
jgi:hypothetical protein